MLISVNACRHLVQNFLSARLVSKNIHIKICIYKTIILLLVYIGVKLVSDISERTQVESVEE
jgi:hypothetical protein